MATETGRHRLYEKIKESWGEDNAAELMSYLPPVGWADVATKQDLDALRVATQQDVKLLSAELRVEIKKVRSDVGDKITALQSEMHNDSRTQLRWMVGSVLTIQIASIGTFAAIVGWIV